MCETAGANRSCRIQVRADGPWDESENQAGLPIKQNSHFPYLSFQEGMLASKLLKNVWRQQPRDPPQSHTFFSQQLVVREINQGAIRHANTVHISH